MVPANEGFEVHDRDEICRRRFEKMQRDFLKTLVTPEVIEEHRRSTEGQHSEALERLLIYFRRRPLPGKYVIAMVEQSEGYRIVALSGLRGVPPGVVEDKIYRSPEEARHGVFLRGVQELLES